MAWLQTSLVVSVLLAMASAQMPGLGACPQYNAKKDFNIQEFMGMWYESERMFQVLEVASRCIAANYSQQTDGTLRVTNFVTSRLTNIQRVFDGELQLKGREGEGKIVVKYNVIPVTTYDTEYTVLDTDYKNYAVLYHCSNPVSFFNTQNAWIMTRERYPSQDALQAAYGILDRNKINRTGFYKTNQEDCDNPTNAEGPTGSTAAAPAEQPATSAKPPSPAAAPAS